MIDFGRYIDKGYRKAVSILNYKKNKNANDRLINLISNYCSGFEGKKILEVGVDQNGVLLTKIIKQYNANEAIGINIVVCDKTILDNCKVFKGDIRKTDFPDNYFDVIISSSVFEHVQNFDVALNEMYRILKPDGFLYSHFGPIWSTTYGHHLWTHFNFKLYNYWNFKLPPYCHLLMTPSELTDYCVEKTADIELSKSIVRYVYESDEQNKLMFEDYQQLIKLSKFRILFFKGYDHPKLSYMYSSQKVSENIQLLKDKYPGYSNFMYDGITLLLKK